MADLLPPPIASDVRQRALARLAERISAIDLSPLLIYVIDTVDAAVLPYLAEQFHILGDEGWSLARTDKQRRALLKRAIPLHRYKGTVWAVQEVFRVLDIDIELIEWWQQTPRGAPYSFLLTAWINANLSPEPVVLDEDLYVRLIRMVNVFKPARSAFGFRVGARFEDRLGVANATRARALRRDSAETRYTPRPLSAGITAASATRARAVCRRSGDSLPMRAATSGALTFANAVRTRAVLRTVMEAQ